MHQQALDWIGRQVDDWREPATGQLPPWVRVLEFGSLDINGSVRSVLAGAGEHHGIDLVAGPGVDEVADASTWTPPGRVELVVCAEVLEHAPAWPLVLGNAWDGVKPGGRLLMTCAGDGRAPHSAVDGLKVRPGEHYANLTIAEVARLVDTWETSRVSLYWAAGRGDLYLRADRPGP